MATPHFHKERLSELIRREITAVVARELRDPRIPSIVTITKVQLGADARNATVFISIFDNEVIKTEVIKALNKAASYIQRIVASRITIKHFPRLYFKLDDSLEHTQHIHQLLKEINDDLG